MNPVSGGTSRYAASSRRPSILIGVVIRVAWIRTWPNAGAPGASRHTASAQASARGITFSRSISRSPSLGRRPRPLSLRTQRTGSNLPGRLLGERLGDRLRLVEIEAVHAHFEHRAALLDHQAEAGTRLPGEIHVVRVGTDAADSLGGHGTGETLLGRIELLDGSLAVARLVNRERCESPFRNPLARPWPATSEMAIERMLSLLLNVERGGIHGTFWLVTWPGFCHDASPRRKKTCVVVMSEFGRTLRKNGTRSTDHGHGTAYWVRFAPCLVQDLAPRQTDASRMGVGWLCFATTSLTMSTNSGTRSLGDWGLYASAMCISMCGSGGVTGRSTIDDLE